MQAFNAPYSMMMLEIDAVGMYDTAAEEMGKIFITTELAGGGTTRASTVAVAKRGVRNLLIHAGILSGRIEQTASQMLDMPSDDCFVFSQHDGLIEPCIDLGQPVRKGDVIAKVWPIDRTGAAPVQYHAAMGGVLVGRHFPGLVKTGDCVAVAAQIVP
jgi:N2-acetyl-L-2,4-diaminobutanoate deacetylase